MHKKKHDQFKNIHMNQDRGLRLGGVVVPAVPSYYGVGMGGSMSTAGIPEGSETAQSEAQEAASGTSEAGESMSSGSADSGAASGATGGSAGGM
jgi:hypothetical protein